MIILICNLILLSVGLILLYQAKKIKIQRTEQANRIQQKIDQQTKILLALENQKDAYQLLVENTRKYLDDLHKESNDVSYELKQRKNNLTVYYETLKQQIKKSFEEYSNTIDKCYDEKQKEFTNKIKQIERSRQQVENQLTQIKNVYQAATAAKLREQENQEKKKFYQLQIPEKQISDIQKLEYWKSSLYEPTIVAKIIWSSYIMKPATDMCNRILGSSIICGIYKITNNQSGEIYIGQSVDIATRWKNHIKCGLGIDASSTNKLYNNMQEYGVWNFSFEVLQKCSRDKLNEKQRFWIEMYQSNKTGMNATKGNK